LPKRRRCELLEVARSSAYYRPETVSEADLALMRLIDEIHLQFPFYGSRRMRDELEDRGHTVNRKRVQRLMRLMDLRALYPRRRTSQPGKGHKIYPYLLRELSIERANQAWATDITYLPMAKGFMYLVAIMDWHSRRVLSWRVSNTLDTDFCTEALEEALQRFGPPEIFNTDQGSQFTSEAFTRVLKDHGIAISMDGKGRWVDNVFVERLWRSVKYEDVVCYERNCRGMRRKRCFTKDEGRPLEVGLQKRASNRHKLRGLRVPVVSVAGKGGARLRQVRVEETNASESLMTCRNVFKWRRNRNSDFCSVKKVGGRLLTAQLAPGMKAA
jgi:putative transposase